MKWIYALLVIATIVVGSLATSRAEPVVQSSIVPCLCDGSSSATVYAHSWIATVTDSGEVKDGRCHRPPPSLCTQSKLCHAQLNWIITANPGYLPFFEWFVDGIAQPYVGYRPEYVGSYDEWIPCGQTRNVAIRANGGAVLKFDVRCGDCSD